MLAPSGGLLLHNAALQQTTAAARSLGGVSDCGSQEWQSVGQPYLGYGAARGLLLGEVHLRFANVDSRSIRVRRAS